MTSDEKIKEVLNSLRDATISGAIKWELHNHIFNTEKCHNYRAFSDDRTTHFDLEIYLHDNLNTFYESALWIYNPGFVDGKKRLAHDSIIFDIQNFIFQNQIKPNLTHRNEDMVLDNVLNSIGNKSYIRDRKLSEILDSDEDESFLKRIFTRKL